MQLQLQHTMSQNQLTFLSGLVTSNFSIQDKGSELMTNGLVYFPSMVSNNSVEFMKQRMQLYNIPKLYGNQSVYTTLSKYDRSSVLSNNDYLQMNKRGFQYFNEISKQFDKDETFWKRFYQSNQLFEMVNRIVNYNDNCNTCKEYTDSNNGTFLIAPNNHKNNATGVINKGKIQFF